MSVSKWLGLTHPLNYMNHLLLSILTYQYWLLYFRLCGQAGKQELRHCPVLRNQCRKVRLARFVYLGGHVIQIPGGNLPLFRDQFQHLFRELGYLSLVQRIGFHGG